MRTFICLVIVYALNQFDKRWPQYRDDLSGWQWWVVIAFWAAVFQDVGELLRYCAK